jgi:hypothetical protein
LQIKYDSGKVLTDEKRFSQGELANYQSICNHYLKYYVGMLGGKNGQTLIFWV